MKCKAAILSCLMAFPALADWQLDNSASRLSFVSIKKGDIAEVHHFERLTGDISDNGQARLAIDLASVNTNIEIRDQRMRDFLFKTTKFSQATLTTEIDMAFINAMAIGEQKAIPLTATFELHGQKTQLATHAQVAKLAKNKVQVNALKPLLLNAKQLGLAPGVEKLREIAQLPSISHAVPVSFTLTFTAN